MFVSGELVELIKHCQCAIEEHNLFLDAQLLVKPRETGSVVQSTCICKLDVQY